MAQSSVLMCAVAFLKPYQQMCRQLDALLTSSCLFTQPKIKCHLRTPTAGFPGDGCHNWPERRGDITRCSPAHPQQVHSTRVRGPSDGSPQSGAENFFRRAINSVWQHETQWWVTAKRKWRQHPLFGLHVTANGRIQQSESRRPEKTLLLLPVVWGLTYPYRALTSKKSQNIKQSHFLDCCIYVEMQYIQLNQ